MWQKAANFQPGISRAHKSNTRCLRTLFTNWRQCKWNVANTATEDGFCYDLWCVPMTYVQVLCSFNELIYTSVFTGQTSFFQVGDIPQLHSNCTKCWSYTGKRAAFGEKQTIGGGDHMASLLGRQLTLANNDERLPQGLELARCVF